MATGYDDWSSGDIERQNAQVHSELMSVFGHDAAIAQGLLEQWLIYDPKWSPDQTSHQGPFHMALILQYVLVEKGEPTSPHFIEWRKKLEAKKYHHSLSAWQEAALRDRGWNGS